MIQPADPSGRNSERGPMLRWIDLILNHPLPVLLLLGVALLAGLAASPFEWAPTGFPRSPVSVDAIPDVGDNQQIVFTEWPGHSPRDVEDQVTYPLTSALLGVGGVTSVRSTSMLGVSSIYLLFDDTTDFYWARSRILEKLNSLPAGTLPAEVRPQLGPDATALGQVLWYTLESRDEAGRRVNAWDLHELRSIQDWTVRYGLMAVDGVAEVASVGGHVREFQVDVDPDAMRAYGVTLHDVAETVRHGNVDVGARTLEINRVEYLVRGLGALEELDDLRSLAVRASAGAPVTLSDIATVRFGPAERRGALDRAGEEVVGGVVVARRGANPAEVVRLVRQQMDRVAAGLPSRRLEDGREVRLQLVPFYDRGELIRETVGTLERTLSLQIVATLLVVLALLGHGRSAVLLGVLLPAVVLLTFGGMRLLGVEANLVSLAGIAIAVGSVVDAATVLCENVLRRLREQPAGSSVGSIVRGACAEVGGAVTVAMTTTVISFLPVFTMQGPEGKLFGPLAATKTLVLIGSIVLTLTWVPIAARWILGWERLPVLQRRAWAIALFLVGVGLLLLEHRWAWLALAAGAIECARAWLPASLFAGLRRVALAGLVGVVLVALAAAWEPAGGMAGRLTNLAFAAAATLGIVAAFALFRLLYPRLLGWTLQHKAALLLPCCMLVGLGATIWLGIDRTAAALPGLRIEPASRLARAFPGLGREFMPPLDEGAFLLMPTLMPHASIGQARTTLARLDEAVAAIPEVDTVVGKIGRVDSALDPAPLSMVETLIDTLPEYRIDADGRRLRFRFDEQSGTFPRDEAGQPIPDPDGRPFRQWRNSIRSSHDIWREISAASRLPGLTGAPKLHPIETRRIMLQTGLRAPLGVKLFAPDLQALDRLALEVEALVREVEGVDRSTVFADRGLGKPYLEIEMRRERLARYGVHVADLQEVIRVAVGGEQLTQTFAGRERYPVRVRYPRELRDRPDMLEQILVPTPAGTTIPLGELATIRYARGPQSIRSEDAFPVTFVTFDRLAERAEVDVAEAVVAALDGAIDSGRLRMPPGARLEVAGTYENQVRAMQRLRWVVPLALVGVLLALYAHFRSLGYACLAFSGVGISWAGGFVLLWLYGQPWFLDFDLFGVSLRQAFGIGPIQLSVAVWVGFLALFGIAVDDGVVVATRLQQGSAALRNEGTAWIREVAAEAGRLRIRACLLTSATTIVALLPVLGATGRGSDLMRPIAVPLFGGMFAALISVLWTPVLFSAVMEGRGWLAALGRGHAGSRAGGASGASS